MTTNDNKNDDKMNGFYVFNWLFISVLCIIFLLNEYMTTNYIKTPM